MKDFVVASFGAGQANRRITPDEAEKWGALEWSFPLIDVLFDGPSDATDYIAAQLIPEGQYFRFQVPLAEAYDDLDRADDANLNALRSLATQYIDSVEGKKLLSGLVEKLTSQSNAIK